MQALMISGRCVTDAEGGNPGRELFLCLWNTESCEHGLDATACLFYKAKNTAKFPFLSAALSNLQLSQRGMRSYFNLCS